MSKIAFATANDSPQGGAAAYRNLSVGVTGAIVKASPGRIYGWQLTNLGDVMAYVKIYNKAAAPTAADVPILVLGVPAGSSCSQSIGPGVGISAGIGIRATTGVPDDDVAAPDAGSVIAHIFYA